MFLPGEIFMAGETVLITGASSGIGLELAKRFAADGCRLILVGRPEGNLDSAAESLWQDYRAHVSVIHQDLTNPAAPQAIFDQLTKENVEVDIVVNNADFGLHGRVADLPIEKQLAMVQLNVVSVTQLTRLFLPKMLERQRGGILNLGSTGSYQPGPNAAVYFATKAYILSFTEALAEELASTSLHVTCLTPGPTATNFGADSGMGKTFFFRLNLMDPKTVAQVGYEAFRRGKVIAIPGKINQFLVFMVRLTPRFLIRKVMSLLQ
jgi:short-subunit dehydrogenase